MFLQEPGRISVWIFLRCLLFSLIALHYTQTSLKKMIIWFVFRDFGGLSVDNQDLCFSFQFLITLQQWSALIPFICTFLLLSVIPILLFLSDTPSLFQTTSWTGQMKGNQVGTIYHLPPSDGRSVRNCQQGNTSRSMSMPGWRKRMAAQTLRDPAKGELLRQYRKTTQ